MKVFSFLLGSTLLSGLLACGGAPPVTPEPPPASGPDGGAPQTEGPPTWHQDIAPIVSANCAGCHAEGGIAHLPLTTVETATPLAHAIAGAVSAGVMPPWPPSGPSMRHERSLTEGERTLLSEWAFAGAPEGDPATAAALPEPEVIDIGTPEITVDIGVDYVPDATLDDDYRCFLVPLGTDQARMATGYRVTPGDLESVHHVLIYLFAASDQATLEALDAEDTRPGWQCFGAPTPSASAAQAQDALGGWVPGTSAVELTPGVGVQLDAGMLAVVQVHYHVHGGGTPASDRTKIEIALASSTEAFGLQRQITLPVPKTDILIPADTADHSEVLERQVGSFTGGQFFPDGDAYVVGVIGHMHLLGKSFSLTLTDPEGNTRPVLEIPKWDFNWQGTYQLSEPIRFGAADVVRMECRYDNSAAHRQRQGFETSSGTVRWGEGTFDEMCLAFVMLTDNAPVGP